MHFKVSNLKAATESLQAFHVAALVYFMILTIPQ